MVATWPSNIWPSAWPSWLAHGAQIGKCCLQSRHDFGIARRNRILALFRLAEFDDAADRQQRVELQRRRIDDAGKLVAHRQHGSKRILIEDCLETVFLGIDARGWPANCRGRNDRR